jgi:hypothetical protein
VDIIVIECVQNCIQYSSLKVKYIYKLKQVKLSLQQAVGPIGFCVVGIPRCVDDHPAVDGKVVSLTHQERSIPQNHNFLLMVLISVRHGVNPRV